MAVKGKKRYSLQQAMEKGRAYCTFQERCHQEMRDRLYSWGQHKDDVENTIAALIEDDFLNEERFAKAYARGKFRMKKWGRNKIVHQLKTRQVSDHCIRVGVAEIDDTEYHETLAGLVDKKMRSMNEPNEFIKKDKVSKYLIGRGFEADLVGEELKRSQD